MTANRDTVQQRLNVGEGEINPLKLYRIISEADALFFGYKQRHFVVRRHVPVVVFHGCIVR